MKTLKQLQEFIEDYGGEPDYEILVKTFDGAVLTVSNFTYHSDKKTFTIHTEKIKG